MKQRYKNSKEVNVGMVMNLKVGRRDKTSTKIRGFVGGCHLCIKI